ncbi:TonB family protein [Sphingomonas sp. Leaf357]|uniref:TonB family protein n=1 Tax=Sphingomonas sp. Leaf357 TaxID=1736350 RepID=UPI0009EBF7E2|nr:TonB family protein [Sphingomonas sp. Leaf357]
MSFAQSGRKDRVRGAILAIVVQAGLGYALIAGLAVHFPQVARDSLAAFNLLPPRPPPPKEILKPHKVVSRKAEGAASPPNLRSKATEVVAPQPIIPPPVPPPIPVAEKPGVGNQATAGKANVIGPGTGSGGQGDGTGNGRSGDGDGDGGREIPPRQTKGEIGRGDWPFDIAEAGIGGKVSVRYLVTLSGRAANCVVTRSSGSRELDLLTCRLIEQRFRFKPSRDANNRPVESQIVQDHYWINQPGE